MLVPRIWMALAIGVVTSYLAWKRDKNPVLWFFLGSLFGVFGLLYLVFGQKKQTAARPRKKKSDPMTIDITPNIDPTYNNKSFWYYLDPGNTQKGPMSFDGLNRAWREGKLAPSTYVWNENLENWRPLKEFLTTEAPSK